MIILNLNKINLLDNNIKEYSYSLEMQIKKSIKKYAQLKPLIVKPQSDNNYILIEGYLLYKCLIDLGFNKAYCVNVGFITELEILDLKLKLYEHGDCNILQQAQLICNLLKKYTIEQISKETEIPYEKIIILKDILKINYQSKENKVIQTSMFEL